MSDIFQCGDTAALVGYAYDECETAERDAIAAHLALCPACAAELAALASTRRHLASWTPPEVGLGFQIVRPDANGLKPAAWWRQPIPAWAQVAAAALIFAAGLLLGVARGGMAPASSAEVTAAAPPAPASAAVSPEDLLALEERLRAEIAEARAVPVVAAAPAPPASESRVLTQVRGMIEDSERRQQRELALRMTQLGRDFETQRQSDWTRIQQVLGQFEGATGAEIRRQRQELNNLNTLIRVSQGR